MSYVDEVRDRREQGITAFQERLLAAHGQERIAPAMFEPAFRDLAKGRF